MNRRLSLVQVDALIESLDRSEPGSPEWQSNYEALRHDLMYGRRLRQILRVISETLNLIFFTFILLQLAANRPWTDGFWLIALNALLGEIIGGIVAPAIFPVLRRDDRAAALLRYHGADMPIEDNEPVEPPENVLAALIRLETATEPAALGPDYGIAERWWTSRQQRWSFNQFYRTIVWLIALGIAWFGADIGVPDFWRGAAFMFVLLTLLHQWSQGMRDNSHEKRVQHAIDRWRHLVPAMREPPL